ncbi:MAG: ABC transporter ATP-binding protein/permease [Anaeroplasmataceae bacterium]|nr:ABC transporter ATP-binding protein/permease [Anaeroplasmataceae bacterium]MDE6414647.1 ABC transporter ATP-binding protein/permease [Anaeroplasmataceae bacterium]
MNKQEFLDILYLAQKEIAQEGKLSNSTKDLIIKEKENHLEELTESEKIELYKLLQATSKKENSPTMAQPSLRFGGRGPRSFGTGEKAENRKGTMLRLLKYFQKEIPLVSILFFAILVVVLCNVITPRLQSSAIDSIDQGDFDSLYPYLFWMIGFFVLLSIFNLVQGFISAILSQKIVKKMRSDLFHKIIHLPVVYFDTHSHGDIMSRMTNDVDNISNTLAQSLSSLFSGIMMIIGTLIIMFITSWQLASMTLVVILLTVLTTKFLSKAMKKYFKRRQILLGKLNGTVEEMVTSYRTVASYSKAEDIIEEFADTSKELTKAGIVAEILGGSMGPIMNAISNIGFVIIAAFGGYFATKEIVSIGVISAFIIYAKEFSRPLNEIASLYGQLQTAIASAERVFIIFDSPAENDSGIETMENKEGNIAFSHVNFSYANGKQVLFDFNLDIHSGEKIALVGHTGSGKTTVVNLLMRFYDVNEGNIFIDGVDIQDINKEELRRNTAIVLQDTILFHDTIRNNLLYSNPFATEEEMQTASKECHCDSFIEQMKGEYDAILSEGGSNLSQGQRQLLSIARAFIAKPKILILDEATSSVDTRTEKLIQDAMVQLMKNKTSLIIAHRLSTILDADKIIVMDQGRIVESGNHDSLMKQKGKYYELYMTQFAGNAL